MITKLSKAKLLRVAKNVKNITGEIEYGDKSFTINNVYGECMQKQDQQITLKNIYQLVIWFIHKVHNLETKVNIFDN